MTGEEFVKSWPRGFVAIKEATVAQGALMVSESLAIEGELLEQSEKNALAKGGFSDG